MILASPVRHPLSLAHSCLRPGPAAAWIAPSTPPPPRSEVLAALTMAPVERAVMEPWWRLIFWLREALGVKIGEAEGVRREVGEGGDLGWGRHCSCLIQMCEMGIEDGKKSYPVRRRGRGDKNL